MSLLAANQGLLRLAGSQQTVNFTHPEKSDFLAFKVGGYRVGIISPMLGMVRLFGQLIHDSIGKRNQLEAQESRFKEAGGDLANYVRGKLSPVASFAADVASQSDFQGRPLPFSKDKVPSYLARQGVKRYTYGEYVAEKFTPIPVSEAITEVWDKMGVSESDQKRWIGAIITGVAAGATGARVTPDKSTRNVHTSYKTNPQ
jgi:hypothetical protein